MAKIKDRFDKVLGIRIIVLVCIDILVINCAALGALLTRFEFNFATLQESQFVQAYLSVAPYYTVAAIVIFTLLRLYRSLWEFAGIDELLHIAGASALSAAAGFGLSLLLQV